MKSKIKKFLFGSSVVVVILGAATSVLIIGGLILIWLSAIFMNHAIAILVICVFLFFGTFFVYWSNRIGRTFYQRYKAVNKQTIILWLKDEPLPRPPIEYPTTPWGIMRPLEWDTRPYWWDNPAMPDDGGVEVDDNREEVK